jgi:hypothetical protein
MSPRKQPYFYLGILSLVLFALSGKYLQFVVLPKWETEHLIRMMSRANHIYLLFMGLLILVASQVEAKGSPTWIRIAVAVGKITLCVSWIVLTFAFFHDATGNLETRSATLPGSILALVGSALISVKAFSHQPKTT